MVTEELRRHVARHEAAHALAYLVNGLPVDYFDVDEGITWGDSRDNLLLTPKENAQISMAGPGFEIHTAIERRGRDEALRSTFESWHEEATEALGDLDDHEPSDLLSAGRFLFEYVGWGYAFAVINRDLIIELGDAALARGGRLVGADFTPQFESRVQDVPDDDKWAANELFAPYIDEILEVERILDAWRLATSRLID